MKYVKENELLLKENTIYIDSVKNKNKNIDELILQRPNVKAFGIPLALNFYNLGDPDGPKSPSEWGEKNPKTYAFFKNAFSEKQSISVAKSSIGINNWFLKSGEAPVIIDNKKTKKTVANLKTYFQNQGYFRATINATTDSIEKKTGTITYNINKGDPLFIDSIYREINSPVLDSIYKLNTIETHLKPKQQYNDANFIKEADRLTKLFRNNGIYHFTKNESIAFYADTTDLKTDVELVISDRIIENNGIYSAKPYRVQKIKSINVYSDYSYSRKDKPIADSISYEDINFLAYQKLRYNPKYLSQSVFISPNTIYSDTLVDLTRTHLRGLNNFKSTAIRFTELNDEELEANIYLTPIEKYTLGFDTELSRSNIRNFDISGRFSLTNRNTFKGAEVFQVSLLGSYFNSNNGPGWEFGTDISLEVPRFLAPFGLNKFVPKRMFPKTRFYTGINIQKNIGLDRQNINLGIDYKWKFNKQKTIQLELINGQYIKNLNVENYFLVYASEYEKLKSIANLYDENLVFPENTPDEYYDIKDILTEIEDSDEFRLTNPDAYVDALNIDERLNIITSDFLIPEIAYGFTYNNQENIKDQEFSSFKFRIANSGNILGLISNKTNDLGKTTILNIPLAQYFKTDIEYKKYWNLRGNSTLAHRTFLGAIFNYNNSEIPFSVSYFAGGSNDIRAWRTYELGPGRRPRV
ncbi:BamA/TamA family outer membrane protein [Tenacibaculum sp. SG-28]|uniref:translocation and assembly module lipoprotein TamL n=1 Tax=Tenacibaculum sp. SG-28 TaxID=754426 RepID=UPI002101C31E|nr:BamA/TamA family outer membrane protein [Tenacibaculum sp. SG-28]